MGIGQVYAEGRGRISELVRALDDEDSGRRVPTCPEWTVADVIAHLAGICADILVGNLAGVATEPWTAAQVGARKGRHLAELVEEWSDLGPQVEAFADNFPDQAGRQWVTDLTTHEHDIRTALGRPGARDSQGVGIGREFVVTAGLHPTVSALGLPRLVVRAGERSWVVGTGDRPGGIDEEVAATPALVALPFELLRALTGRRSTAQIRQLDWSIDPAPYLPAFRFGPFMVGPGDVVE